MCNCFFLLYIQACARSCSPMLLPQKLTGSSSSIVIYPQHLKNCWNSTCYNFWILLPAESWLKVSTTTPHHTVPPTARLLFPSKLCQALSFLHRPGIRCPWCVILGMDFILYFHVAPKDFQRCKSKKTTMTTHKSPFCSYYGCFRK